MNDSSSNSNRKTIQLLSIKGIRITIDYSWFVIFALVLWSLSVGYFPYRFPGEALFDYWLAGIVATVFLFASVVFHELSHSLVAINAGISIPEITLFIFGGVSRLSQEANTPQNELKIAIAGPASSFLMAIIFKGISFLLSHRTPGLIPAVFDYLAFINVLLGAFNLIPGFPMDGGRVLRSLLWWKTGSLVRATRIASEIGKTFGLLLIMLGIYGIFVGSFIGGIWFALIGLFLRGIASREYQELIIRKSLEGIHAKEVMIHDLVTVPPTITLDRLVNDYFIAHCYLSFPVTLNGEIRGIVSLSNIKDIPEETRKDVTVEQVMTPISNKLTVHPDVSLADALTKMNASDAGRLLVLKGSILEGMITKAGLLRFLEIKSILRKH
jgi:Zn-dependent protease